MKEFVLKIFHIKKQYLECYFFTFILLLANFIDHTIDVAIESVRIDIQRLTFAGQDYKRGFDTVQGIDYSQILKITFF